MPLGIVSNGDQLVQSQAATQQSVKSIVISVKQKTTSNNVHSHSYEDDMHETFNGKAPGAKIPVSGVSPIRSGKSKYNQAQSKKRTAQQHSVHLNSIFVSNGADSAGVRSILRESDENREFTLSLDNEHIIQQDQLDTMAPSTADKAAEKPAVHVTKRESGTSTNDGKTNES